MRVIDGGATPSAAASSPRVSSPFLEMVISAAYCDAVTPPAERCRSLRSNLITLIPRRLATLASPPAAAPGSAAPWAMNMGPRISVSNANYLSVF